MNRIMNSTIKPTMVRRLWKVALVITLATQMFTASPAVAVITPPVLWTAGGHSAGTDSAGQAARIATDAFGNVAVVSGPSLAIDLAVTSYTATGLFRWRGAVSPSSGTFRGDWVAAAPNGDFVAVGHNVSAATGNPIAITMVRFGSNGALQWRVDLAGLLPSVGRLLVDSSGNAYLAFNSLGDGQDIQLHKYNPAGSLLWSKVINTGLLSNNIATSLALSADETQVALTGDTIGGAEWITALYDTSTGNRRWLVTAAEGTAARDVVIDESRVYVTGQGSIGISAFLTLVAYDRMTGARLWRTDKRPAGSGNAAGLRMAKGPDGSLVVTGQALLGFLDWYTVAFETNGTVRWEAVRDGGLNTDEVPAAVLVLPDGTTVVTGKGGPNLPGGFIPGVTAGYSSAGILLWEAFSRLETVWATTIPNGDVCATGGYDALITCWEVSSTPTPTPAPITISGTILYCSNPVPGPVPNVTLTLTGTMGSSTSSDGSGNYTFSSLPFGGDYTVTPTKAPLLPASTGINTVDVIATQRHFLLIGTPLSGCPLTAADVDLNTSVNTVDVVAIQRFFLGLTTGIANVGRYNFSPANRSYPGLFGNQTDQNYGALVFGDVASSFVHRLSGSSQGAGREAPATVATVTLPEIDHSRSNFIAAVTTSAIDAKDSLVGFQGDFTFDERTTTFESEPVQEAGLTAGNWNVAGNILDGPGPIRTLRVSAFSNDFTPLSGEGTLFELRMKRMSKIAQGTDLVSAAPPDNFIFIDADLRTQKPGETVSEKRQ